jgi:hypothetical protein
MTQTQFNFNNFYTTGINGLTLQEALDIHYDINPQFTPWDSYDSDEARSLIKAHDISHVIFGCDTSYIGEVKVQTWGKYGANLNIPLSKRLRYLSNKDLRALVVSPNLIGYILSHTMVIFKARQAIRTRPKSLTLQKTF